MYKFLKDGTLGKLASIYLDAKDKNKANKAISKAMGKGSYSKTAISNIFYNSAYQFLSSVPPIKRDEKYSITETFRNIQSLDSIDTGIVNLTIDEFRDMYKFLYFISPSTWVTGNQTSRPRFSSLVPFMLAAYKECHGIQYEEWDLTDENAHFMVGRRLASLLEYRGLTILTEPIHLRRLVYTNKEGILSDDLVTQYDASKFPKGGSMRIDIDLSDIGCVALKKTDPIIVMHAQYWLGHPKYRTDLMVGSLSDWDAIPPVLDDSMDVSEQERGKSSKSKPKVDFEKLPF